MEVASLFIMSGFSWTDSHIRFVPVSDVLATIIMCPATDM